MIFTQKMVKGTSSRDCVHVSFDLQCGRNRHSIKFKFTIILIRRMQYVFVAGLIQPVYQKNMAKHRKKKLPDKKKKNNERQEEAENTQKTS